MTVRVDHNYPGIDDMRVINAQADPIEGAAIRIFELTAFQAGDVDTWVGETLTDVNGEWIDPIYLDDAKSWVVHFQKLTEYGPEHVEITT